MFILLKYYNVTPRIQESTIGPSLWVRGVTFLSSLLIRLTLANFGCLLAHVCGIAQFVLLFKSRRNHGWISNTAILQEYKPPHMHFKRNNIHNVISFIMSDCFCINGILTLWCYDGQVNHRKTLSNRTRIMQHPVLKHGITYYNKQQIKGIKICFRAVRMSAVCNHVSYTYIQQFCRKSLNCCTMIETVFEQLYLLTISYLYLYTFYYYLVPDTPDCE